MATQTHTDQQAPQHGYSLAEIPIAQIDISSHNPRTEFDAGEIERLAHAMRTRGFNHPILVKPGEGEDRFEIIDGERRWRAAQLAQIETLPALIKHRPDAPGSDLLDAMLANGLGVSLNVLEEALGFQALLDEGHYTRKGIAEAFKIPLARVRERLQILELPPSVREQLLDGTVPLLAVKTLAAITKIHAELPALAVKRVLDSQSGSWREPLSWEELADDPVTVLIGGYGEDLGDLPEDVFASRVYYSISRFELDKRASKDLAELCELCDCEVEEVSLCFHGPLLEQARSLGAAHVSADEQDAIIIGSDVANQLAGDWLKARLRQARADDEADRVLVDEGSGASASEADEPGEQLPPPEAEQIEAGEKRAKEEDRRLREETIAANQALGAALVKHLAKVKVDGRVMKVLSCAPFANGLADVASRGARLAFPGFAELSKRKNGTTKADYPDTHESHEKARAYLDGATTPSEIAGRLLTLLGAARWANQKWAIPRSKASNYELRLSHYYSSVGVPWSVEAEELLDEILAERLPEEIAKPIAEARERAEAARAEEARRGEVRDADVAEFRERAPQLSKDQRHAEINRLRREYGFTAIDIGKSRELMELPEPHEAMELAVAA